MGFRIRGLDFAPFQSLVGQSDQQLIACGARRMVAGPNDHYPDRIELRDANPGESLLLVNYRHQPAHSPYNASHAVFVLEHPDNTYDSQNQIPGLLRGRTISARAFDHSGMIVDAELCEGTDLEGVIERLFRAQECTYIQLHYAKFGCFACQVDRFSGPE